jgi:hypothetical protein
VRGAIDSGAGIDNLDLGASTRLRLSVVERNLSWIRKNELGIISSREIKAVDMTSFDGSILCFHFGASCARILPFRNQNK